MHILDSSKTKIAEKTYLNGVDKMKPGDVLCRQAVPNTSCSEDQPILK